MTFLVSNVQFYLIMFIFLGSMIGVFSYAVYKLLQKQKETVQHKLEKILPFVFVLFIIGGYYAVHTFFTPLQEGDTVVTATNVDVAQAGDRLFSTERYTIIPDVYRTIGFFKDIKTDNLGFIRVRVLIDDVSSSFAYQQRMIEQEVVHAEEKLFSMDAYFLEYMEREMIRILQDTDDMKQAEKKLALLFSGFNFELIKQ